MTFEDDAKDPHRDGATGYRRPHLTPDLPPVTEAPELKGAARTRPEDSPAGRQAKLPPPYGPGARLQNRQSRRDGA